MGPNLLRAGATIVKQMGRSQQYRPRKRDRQRRSGVFREFRQADEEPTHPPGSGVAPRPHARSDRPWTARSCSVAWSAAFSPRMTRAMSAAVAPPVRRGRSFRTYEAITSRTGSPPWAIGMGRPVRSRHRHVRVDAQQVVDRRHEVGRRDRVAGRIGADLVGRAVDSPCLTPPPDSRLKPHCGQWSRPALPLTAASGPSRPSPPPASSQQAALVQVLEQARVRPGRAAAG